jgi:hypothetical protein
MDKPSIPAQQTYLLVWKLQAVAVVVPEVLAQMAWSEHQLVPAEQDQPTQSPEQVLLMPEAAAVHGAMDQASRLGMPEVLAEAAAAEMVEAAERHQQQGRQTPEVAVVLEVR